MPYVEYQKIKRRSINGTYCRECGGPMFVTDDGGAHHGSPKAIRHEDDADHVALAEKEQWEVLMEARRQQ